MMHSGQSPSSRRAWIEMLWTILQLAIWLVALLAEGVDRNHGCVAERGHHKTSPSSRRAWIEIGYTHCAWCYYAVALLAEGVDRNASSAELSAYCAASPSSRRAWIEISCPAIRLRHWKSRPPRGGRG